MSHILGDIQANSMVSNASDSLAIFHFYHTFKLLLKILLCTCETNEWLEIYLKCKKPVFQFYHYKWRKKTNYQRDFTIFLCYLLFSIQYSFCCAKICYCWFKQFFTYPMESGMVICWTFVCCKISNHIHSTSKFSVWMFFNGGLSLFSPSFKKMFFFCF